MGGSGRKMLGPLVRPAPPGGGSHQAEPNHQPDRAALRKVLAAKGRGVEPVEYVRLNVDLGSPVVLHGFVWGLAAHGMHPTLTLHGSNDAAFYTDTYAALVPGGPPLVGHGAQLLWQLHWTGEGSTWTPEAVRLGQADIYHTRLSSEPRYSRLYVDGRVETADYQGFVAGHVVPPVGASAPPPPFRYYALTVSVGAVAPTDQGVVRYVMELQQWQPILDAPTPTALPPADEAAVLYGRRRLTAGTGDDVLVDLRLTKEVPEERYGYLEVWSTFRTRMYYQLSREWTSSAGFPALDGSGVRLANRRGWLSLPELLVPRRALLRTKRTPLTSLPNRRVGVPPHPSDSPFLWCYVRQRSLRPVGSQAIIIHRICEEGVGGGDAQPLAPAPPGWIHQRDTLRFLLVVGSARIPGESCFITLQSETRALVELTDNPTSALPEVCLVLPSGEVVDYPMYGDIIPLPAETGGRGGFHSPPSPLHRWPGMRPRPSMPGCNCS